MILFLRRIVNRSTITICEIIAVNYHLLRRLTTNNIEEYS